MTTSRFTTLPEPVRLDDTISSQDEVAHAAPSSEESVDAWLLKNAAG